MLTFKQYEIVVVPFPFTDRNAHKRRPALILSDSSSLTIDKSILAMITSSLHHPWPLDVEIDDLVAAGLNSPSIIRMKLFTLDNSLVVKIIGKLCEQDSEKISFNLAETFGF